MPVRLKDIAKELGLSIPAVCKALKGDADISASTRKLVEQKVRERNYRPNLMARSLLSGRSNLLGLVVPALMPSFFAEVAQGVAGTVQNRGYTLLLAASNEEPELEKREIDNLLARGADGLIVASCQGSAGASYFRALRGRRHPFVLLDREIRGVPSSFVGLDNEAIGRLATVHLLERGARRVAHISCERIGTAKGRKLGYRAALSESGLRADSRLEETAAANTVEAGYAAMVRLLARRPLPDAVFCFNDPVAVGAMRAILEAGMRIPEQVRLIGAGNVQFTDLLRAPLSTVDVDPFRAGTQAAELLLHEIQSPNSARPASVRMPLRLIARESTQ